MKTQTFGIGHTSYTYEKDPYPTDAGDIYWDTVLSGCPVRKGEECYVPEIDPFLDYRKHRENGDEQDSPSRPFPKDGKYSGGSSPRSETRYDEGYYFLGRHMLQPCSETRYDEGPKDRVWMQEKDRNYQTRLVRERLAKAAELKTTLIREALINGNAISTIESKAKQLVQSSVWYIHPDLPVDVLPYDFNPTIEDFARERLVKAAELKATLIRNALLGGRAISTIESEAKQLAQSLVWYTHPDFPADTLPYNFSLTAKDLAEIFATIGKDKSIKALNLSGMDLSGYLLELLIKTFIARNDFTMINLAHTSLDDKGLSKIFRALCTDMEQRGMPLVTILNVAENQIMLFSTITDFICACARGYYWQQQVRKDDKGGKFIPTLLSFPLIEIYWHRNLLSISSDEALQHCIFELQEREESMRNLRISVSRDIITIRSSNMKNQTFGRSLELRHYCGFSLLDSRPTMETTDLSKLDTLVSPKMLKEFRREAEELLQLKKQLCEEDRFHRDGYDSDKQRDHQRELQLQKIENGTSGLYWSPVVDYIKKRGNGTDVDIPKRVFPKDGKYSWEEDITRRGKPDYDPPSAFGIQVHFIFEVHRWYWLRYDEGPGDRAWMEERDINYQLRLVHERLIKAEKFKTKVIERTISGSEIIFTRIVEDCMASVVHHNWYVNPDLPVGIRPYDFSFKAEDLTKLFNAILSAPTIKVLNLSNMNLSDVHWYYLLVELFKTRNDFTEINLANTNLTDDKLSELLKALSINQESRGVPLIEKLNLAGNQIAYIHQVIDFIYDSAHAYYWQRQRSGTAPTFPLSQINLECNLICLTEDVDGLLCRYEARLHEQRNPLPNLTISLTGNVITIHVPNPFQEVQRNEWRYGFFVTRHLAQRQSIMQPEKSLTVEDGFVYLVCKKAQFPGHAAIFTEMLNDKGQLELKKLEFGIAAASGSSGGGVISSEPLDAKRLMQGREQLYFQIWQVKPHLIQQLIYSVGATRVADGVKYSSLAFSGGQNCTTWAIDKLRGIGLEVDYRIIPVNAASGKGCVVS